MSLIINEQLNITISNYDDNDVSKRRLYVQQELYKVKSLVINLYCEAKINYGLKTITINKYTNIDEIINDWFK